MSPLSIPTRQAEDPNLPDQFPEGAFVFTIEDTRSATISEGDKRDWLLRRPDGTDRDGNPRKPQIANPGANLVLSIQLGQAQALDTDADPGDRKVFVEFVAEDGPTNILGADRKTTHGTGWRIFRDQAKVANLAYALGQGAEEGGSFVVADDFVDNLAAGVYTNHQVIGRVGYTPWETKDAEGNVVKSGTNQRVTLQPVG